MTTIDFTAEVEKRKEDLLVDLFSLLEIRKMSEKLKTHFTKELILSQLEAF